MNCKNCIHFNVCPKAKNPENYSLQTCKDFKDKENYEEVKHGYWIEDYNYGWWQYTCSLCGADYHNTSPVGEDKQCGYCFDCGAKMDGERKENESYKKNNER